ncbi:hypothetical protein Q7P36_002852 [Cladosporium allicinum]
MSGLGNSNQDPSVEPSAAQTPLEVPPGLPLRTDSLSSVTSSSDDAGIDSRAPEDLCFYMRHLESRRLTIDRVRDFFLIEHLTSGHITGCSHLSDSDADRIVRTAPIRKELPFDQTQIHHLQLVNLRDKLFSPRHIRLLKLCSPTSLDVLRCEAYQACLEDLTTDGQPLFAAASYVCGDQALTRRIICGRYAIDIPQNAYDALVHLRFRNRPRLVWIDCLCINQNDAREKSHQVGILHKIYAQAHVVSWLKLSRDVDLQDASFFLSLFARLWIDEVRGNELCQSADKLGENVVLRLKSHLESQSKALPHRYPLQNITSIFTADYFERVWTAQEIILGKTNVCQVGDELFSLATLVAASHVLRTFGRESGEPTNFKPGCDDVDNEKIDHVCRSYLESALQNSWVELDHERLHDFEVVTTLNQGNCSDPKDYIYGVASLFEQSGGYEVNYTLSEAEVFADFTAHCLEKGDQAFEVLNQDRSTMESIHPHPDLRSDLPSWCPDWSVAGRAEDSRFVGYDLRWQASGQTRLAYARPSTVTLALKGLVVSKIKLCCDSILRATDLWVCKVLPWPYDAHLSKTLHKLLELEGVELDHGARDAILRIFKRMSSSSYLKSLFQTKPSSRRLRSLLGQVYPDDVVALLAPVYLEKFEPGLLKATRLEIDARISRKDYNNIAYTFRSLFTNYCAGGRSFVTEDGKQGVGYPGIRQDDLVCVIYGSQTPQILRRVDGDAAERYILVGPCRMDGLMYGEGLEMGLTEQEFILV